MSTAEAPKPETIEATFTVEHKTGGVDADRATWLATRPSEIATPDDLRTVTALYLNHGKGTGWGKDLTPANARALAVASQKTGLSPLLGEILILGGNVYVTEAGVLVNADRNPQYDGYDLEPLDEDERAKHAVKDDEIAYKCLVYRKDRAHPTLGIGRASRANVGMKPIAENWLPEMAQKRAIERAHSRAFPSGMPLYDEAAMAPQPARISNVTIADAPKEEPVLPELVTSLQRQLKWPDGRLQLEYKTAGGDIDKLIAAMQRSLEESKTGPRAEEKVEKPPQDGPTPADLLMTHKQQAMLFALLTKLGLKTKPARIAWAKGYDVDVESFKQLTEVQAAKLIDVADAQVKKLDGAEVEADGGSLFDEEP